MGGANPELSVVHLLRRAERCALAALEARANELNLTPTQIIVLMAVEAKPGVSQTVLCRATGIDRSTMADVVSRMVRKGLARRSRADKDARAYAVELTPSGAAALNEVRPIAALAEDDLLALLPPRQREEFRECLLTIVHTFAPQQVTGAAG